ncbi:hypothetical protein GIB67_023504 [Kingdonia uniflora]|uniref:TF-B3 domain-containing protein n=1 Tax=Kingdonia uniflora TaxID=39325 RepID=A0A7J7PA34_9MAGN|nr:hypothetical protein GIB67_023504 [Kingdonia uniflora]
MPQCSYLSNNDVMVTLVDENNKEYKIKYTGRGFTTGWNVFSSAPDLVKGDALVLQLFKNSIFQVSKAINTGKEAWQKRPRIATQLGISSRDGGGSQNNDRDGLETNRETILIADGIKTSKLGTFMDDFSTWDQTLEGFEHLGMNIGFLRAKLQRLRNFIPRSECEMYRRKCQEDRIKRIRLEEMEAFEMSLI